MKRFFLIVMATVFALASCSREHDVDYAEYYSFTTVQANRTFLTDDGRTMVPQTHQFEVYPGQRSVIYFNFTSAAEAEKESPSIKLIQVDTAVAIGKGVLVASQEERDKYGTAYTSIQLNPDKPSLTDKYFNFVLGFNCDDRSKHKFTLTYLADDQKPGNTLYLTLCHDEGGDARTGECWQWVSIPRTAFNELMKSYEKVTVYIKTLNSGTVPLVFEI